MDNIDLIGLLLGLICILAGIFRWYPILVLVNRSWGRYETKADVWKARIVSILFGVVFIGAIISKYLC